MKAPASHRLKLIIAIAIYLSFFALAAVRFWNWYDAEFLQSTTCAQINFLRKGMSADVIVPRLEKAARAHGLPWPYPEIQDRIFVLGDQSAILWSPDPPPNRELLMEVHVCGKNRSLQWQKIAKDVERAITEVAPIERIILQRSRLIHADCRSGESCHIEVPISLDFERLNETSLKLRP